MNTTTLAPHLKQVALRDLAPQDATAVTGGKAGRDDPGKFMVIKLMDIVVSGTRPSTS